MGLHGGRWVWTSGSSKYTEEINDTSPSKIAAANARAAAVLGTAGLLKDPHGRGNSSANLNDFGDTDTNIKTIADIG